MVVGAACGGALLGMASFWIWHLYVPLACTAFNLNLLESGPAVVHEFGFASAVYQVTILTADGAHPLALRSANTLHRHTQQNVLPQNILQLDAAAFIKGDFGFTFIDFHFLFVLGAFGRAIKQIEAGIDRKLGRLQAAITIAAHGDRQMSANPDLAECMRKKLGGTFRLERGSLT
jgi:hypothetical protein